MRLSTPDLDRLNSALLELHSHGDMAALNRAVPALLLRVIPADYAQLMEHEPDPETKGVRSLAAWESHPLLTPDLLARFMRLLPEHPFVRRSQRSGRLPPSLLSDFLTRRQFRQTRLHSELYRPVDVGHHLATSVSTSGTMLALCVMRSERARDFDERHRFLMDLLQQHYEQARRTAIATTAGDGHVAATAVQCGLTTREAQVAAWMARGKSNPEIASILDMRLRTVEKHLEHILRKLGADNRTSATLMLTAPSKRKD